jgi:hypothetical protein
VDSESAQSGIVLFVMGRLERKENPAKFDNDCFGILSSGESQPHLLGSEERVLK